MSTGPAKPLLYSFWRSSCSWRVRNALNLKGISYDLKTVDLFKSDGGEQLNDEYRQLNPRQQVPALQIDGNILIESMAILHYLEETRVENPLLPQDNLQRAKVREICEVITSGIQPFQNVGTLDYIGKKNKALEWAQYWIARGFCAVEKLLAASAGKYCVGDQITLADCCLVPQVFNARLYKVDLTPYVTLTRIDRALAEHPAFKAAHPFNQVDCPPDIAARRECVSSFTEA
ncbi:probable maleylacetoacetate isomerase 2 [Sabethes cyaneus]|uniref:probable maleylacetoacetate isomerase 2 n=1 Tax=Sabethes cyaneus TaxID=53552 RepID=UPI00237D811F|nr:probable maleylacetoacetate isomerase 2 [Sabethes cyaneus]